MPKRICRPRDLQAGPQTLAVNRGKGPGVYFGDFHQGAILRRSTRQFVVEIKSSRCRATSRGPVSIWGDIDLKAVAREAETEAEIAQGAFTNPGSQSDSREPEQLCAIPIRNTTSLLEGFQDAKRLVTLASEEWDEQKDDAPPEAAQLSKSDGRSRIQFRPRGKRKGALPPERVTPSSKSNLGDELEGLLAENHRLKLLLRDKFIHDNSLLRELLARH